MLPNSISKTSQEKNKTCKQKLNQSDATRRRARVIRFRQWKPELKQHKLDHERPEQRYNTSHQLDIQVLIHVGLDIFCESSPQIGHDI